MYPTETECLYFYGGFLLATFLIMGAIAFTNWSDNGVARRKQERLEKGQKEADDYERNKNDKEN